MADKRDQAESSPHTLQHGQQQPTQAQVDGFRQLQQDMNRKAMESIRQSSESCSYKSRKCSNARAIKRNGKLHTLCEFHRARQNEHQRKSDRKNKDNKLARQLMKQCLNKEKKLNKHVMNAMGNNMTHEHLFALHSPTSSAGSPAASHMAAVRPMMMNLPESNNLHDNLTFLQPQLVMNHPMKGNYGEHGNNPVLCAEDFEVLHKQQLRHTINQNELNNSYFQFHSQNNNGVHISTNQDILKGNECEIRAETPTIRFSEDAITHAELI